jgi:hypothetical protein
MRAREFINEAKKGLRGNNRADANPEFSAAHPSIVAPHGRGDLYIGRYYDFYRVSQLTGMPPEELEKMDLISFFGNLPAFSGYSEVDREKLFRVMKKLGMKPTDYIPHGSTEVDDTNVVSPVTGFKGYTK